VRRAVEAGYSRLDLQRDPELEGLRQDSAVRVVLGIAGTRRGDRGAAVQQDRRSRMPNPKKVKVTYQNGVVSVDKNTVVVKWRNNEEAVWSCNKGDLFIEFKPGANPFGAMPTNNSSEVHSGLAQNHAKKKYKYTVTVTPDSGDPAVALDPMVDIDDGQPPRPHHKRAKKKTGKKKAVKKKAAKKTAARKAGKKAVRKSGKKKAGKKKR